VRDLAIWIHTVAALLALVAAVACWRTGRARSVLIGATGVMTLALVPALVLDWGDLAVAARIVFAALLVLAGVMTLRAARVGRRPGALARDLDDLGFLVIALVDAFLVISALRLGVPPWGLAAVGVGVAAAGHVTLGRLRARRLAGQPDMRAAMGSRDRTARPVTATASSGTATATAPSTSQGTSTTGRAPAP
jgi:hypothetical protein